MRLRVICYSGRKEDERPLRFQLLDDREYFVEEDVESRREQVVLRPDHSLRHDYFRLTDKPMISGRNSPMACRSADVTSPSNIRCINITSCPAL